ncbi:hypothetical protein [Flavilitoribacter nigricans]|uniref:Uncharacterized protein n=1 Tax=Flavilitoribacter nigricans (strain ATCC 23147 / DSM 23189 / NBRC 102662 / NCIMB 1420 / SS-2) TaxID=1122177 RepID=A0A2D0NEP0_FLAN2|nr:hypothetical protein [Flavilitoribacter nigricans]PHN06836.1 hypothetical protein CRP01_11165 [Flavilitoribacter nigricans DSM 23189 = NBRC 102662]
MKNILKAFGDLSIIGVVLAGFLIAINLIWGDKAPAFVPEPQTETIMGTFKRSDFNLTAEDFVKELTRELTMRQAVYTKQTQQKKLSPKEAAKRYLIIQELKEVMELAGTRGLRIQDIKQMIQDTEIKAKVNQGSMFNNDQYPR